MNKVNEAIKNAEKIGNQVNDDGTPKKHFGYLKTGDICNIDISNEVDSATKKDEERFAKLMQDKVDAYNKRGVKPDWYIILRNSLVQLYFKDALFSFIITILSEGCSVFYSFWIKDLIAFVKSEPTTLEEKDSETWQGLRLVSIFIGCMLLAQIFRNRYI